MLHWEIVHGRWVKFALYVLQRGLSCSAVDFDYVPLCCVVLCVVLCAVLLPVCRIVEKCI